MPTAFYPALLVAGHHDSMKLVTAMFLIFGSAKLLAELFERLGQPGIVGEILAGILIGPSVLGWVAPSEFTSTMAGLGVLFLLFRVGLEVEASELLKVGRTAAAVGVLGVVVPFLSGWLLYRLWGKPELEAVFVGAALTATSVGITAQVLASKGLLKRPAARIILGAAVVDDILALLVLGFVSSLARQQVDLLQLGLTSALGLLFIAVVARWGHKAMSRVVNSMEGKVRLRLGEAHFALAMVFLFGLAALSARIGVAAIIGAFLAGLVLSGTLPARVRDLAQGVTELLVPFFLAQIGLLFQLAVFRDASTLLLALILVPVAVASKVLGCGLGARKSGRIIAIRVGLGMIPRGEFCMVVAQTGLALGAISPSTYAIIVFMAVTAALLAPPLLKMAFRGVRPPPESPEELFRLG